MAAELALGSHPDRTLAGFTEPELLLPRLAGVNAAEIIRELSKAIQRAGLVVAGESFCAAVLKREALANTNLEPGLAFPHARVEGLSRLAFAMGRCVAPVAWGRGTGGSVRLVFLLAVPEGEAMRYLQLLSALARLGGDARLMDRLLAASDAQEMYEVFTLVNVEQKKARQPEVERAGCLK